MGPIWGRQDPDGPHVGPMNLAIWVWSPIVVDTWYQGAFSIYGRARSPTIRECITYATSSLLVQPTIEECAQNIRQFSYAYSSAATDVPQTCQDTLLNGALSCGRHGQYGNTKIWLLVIVPVVFWISYRCSNYIDIQCSLHQYRLIDWLIIFIFVISDNVQQNAKS